MVIGTAISYLFFKTNSIWPCVLFHASLNGMDIWKPSVLFMSEKANPFIGPDLLGIIGGIGFIITAVICFIKMKDFQLPGYIAGKGSKTNG